MSFNYILTESNEIWYVMNLYNKDVKKFEMER